MLTRSYQCQKCKKTFRTPGGREWHIAHRHEAPATLTSIRNEYQTLKEMLTSENKALLEKTQRMETEHIFEKFRLLREHAAEAVRVQAFLDEKSRLEHEQQVLALAVLLQTKKADQPGNASNRE